MNNNQKTMLAFLLILLFAGFENKISAQNNSWIYNNKSSINWYEKTLSGSVIISTEKNLLALDPTSKKELWQLPQYKNLSKGNFYIINNLPLFSISIPDTTMTDSGAVKKKGGGFFKKLISDVKAPIKNFGKGEQYPRKQYVNYLTGEMIFDTKDADIDYLKSVRCFFSHGTAIMQGYNKDTSVISCLSLIDRKKIWQIIRPGKYIKPAFRTPLSVKPDVRGNFILSGTDSMYYLNSATGNFIWANKNSFLDYEICQLQPYLVALMGDSLVKLSTATGKIEQAIAMSEIPGVKKQDPLAFTGLHGEYRKIFLFDTITIVTADDRFIIGGATFPAQKDCEAYIIRHKLKFNNLKPLPDGNMVAIFKRPDLESVGVMKFSSSGKIFWNGQLLIPGRNIRSIFSHPETFVVITNNDVYVADAKTGNHKTQVDGSIPPLDSNCIFSENPAGTHLCIYQSGSLYQLEYKTMQVKEILKKTEFKGGDAIDKIPETLQGLENGWFLAAAQNILLVDFNGKVIYNQYYNKPGMSNKATRLLAWLGGTAAGFVFKNQAGQLTNTFYDADKITTDEYVSAKTLDYMAGGTGSALIAGSFSSKLFGAGYSNLSQLKAFDNTYHLIFGQQEKKPCLFEIDKKTGITKKVIPMSDKSQVMETDFINQGIFTINEDGETFEYFPLKN